MKYKAIIFDLDGTLLYTLSDIALVINKVINELNMPIHTEESYKKFVGYGLKEALRRACTGKCPDTILDKAYSRVIKEYSNNPVVTTRPYNDIPLLLDELTKCGINLAILSNKENSLVVDISSKLLSNWCFTTIQGILPDIPKKPDPSVVHQILKDINVKPSEAIFVGDSGVDMKTAVNSGLLGVGVTWGYRDVIELTKSGAEILIDKPMELLKILDSSNCLTSL